MSSVALLGAVFILVGLGQCQVQKVRFCVPQAKLPLCLQMADDIDSVECIPRADGLSCMEAIEAGEADTIKLDARSLYAAGKHFNLSILAVEDINEIFKHRAIVAVVRKSLELSSLSDLKGKKACFTAYGRTAWQISTTKLILSDVMTPDCKGDIDTVENFFGESCTPGKWSDDPTVDSELKKQHPSLCSLCEDPEKCSENDAYFGYNGALKCLSDGNGDITFSRLVDIEKYVQEKPDFAEEYELLCTDNTRRDIGGGEAPCHWGIRPTDAYVVSYSRTPEEKEYLYSVLNQIFARYSTNIPQIQNQERPNWYTKYFISYGGISYLREPLPTEENPLDHLGEFIHTRNHYFGECYPPTVRFCATSEQGIKKCRDLSKVTRSVRIGASVDCVLEETTAGCIEAVKEGRADLITLDGGDVYRAGRYSNLVPIASELYGGEDATYYAVAVISSNSPVNGPEDLRGLSSCHTGMGRTAGWVMPVGGLTRNGLIPKTQCDKAAAVADFFSASCAPGANDPKYNPSGSGAVKLCQQCIGDANGENICSRSSAERYSGYAGAFRCLVENEGDVAFVKHTTVPEYTDGNSLLSWAVQLNSGDYKLLCKDGGTDEIQNYKNCNFGRVPSHTVMISGNSTSDERLYFAEFLSAINKWFGSSSLRFNLFKPYDNKADLLFKDSTTALKAVPFNATYEDVLGEDYLNAVESTDPRLCLQES